MPLNDSKVCNLNSRFRNSLFNSSLKKVLNFRRIIFISHFGFQYFWFKYLFALQINFYLSFILIFFLEQLSSLSSLTLKTRPLTSALSHNMMLLLALCLRQKRKIKKVSGEKKRQRKKSSSGLSPTNTVKSRPFTLLVFTFSCCFFSSLECLSIIFTHEKGNIDVALSDWAWTNFRWIFHFPRHSNDGG